MIERFLSGAMTGLPIGQYFLTFDEADCLEFQGQIIGYPHAGFYFCQLFSALTGEATCQIIKGVDEMAGWRFYASAEKWRSAYHAHSAAGER